MNAEQSFIWRGWRRYQTSDYPATARTFPIAANQTYHLRWNPQAGFQLKNLSDKAYNPSAHAETHTGFDSIYDDMLIARVVSNAARKAAITRLTNKAKLIANVRKEVNGTKRDNLEIQTGYLSSSFNNNSSTRGISIRTMLDWARTPTVTLREWGFQMGGADEDPTFFTKGVHRYEYTFAMYRWLKDNNPVYSHAVIGAEA